MKKLVIILLLCLFVQLYSKKERTVTYKEIAFEFKEENFKKDVMDDVYLTTFTYSPKKIDSNGKLSINVDSLEDVQIRKLLEDNKGKIYNIQLVHTYNINTEKYIENLSIRGWNGIIQFNSSEIQYSDGIVGEIRLYGKDMQISFICSDCEHNKEQRKAYEHIKNNYAIGKFTLLFRIEQKD